MKAFLLAAILAVSAVSFGDALHDPKFNEALPANRPPGGFVPVVLLYFDGKFMELKQGGDAEDSIVKCISKANDIVGKLMASENRPPQAAVIGACMPIPAAPGAKPAAKGDKPIKPYHDNKPSVLGGINSEKI